MPVYVDNAKLNFGRMKMCHMMADSSTELKEMAAKIGLSMRWIQKPGTAYEHFDLCLAKRNQAVSNGAIEVSMREMVAMIRNKKNKMNKNIKLPTLDWETYSESGYVFNGHKFVSPLGPKGKKGIQLVGAATYAEHPSTEILSLSYDLLDGLGVKLWTSGQNPPTDLFNYIKSGGLIEAHRSLFEFFVWHYVAFNRMGWPALPLSQLRCSRAKCFAYSIPPSLAEAGAVLGLAEQKDKAGSNVMLRLSQPRTPTKNNPALRYTPETSPQEFQILYNYNAQDCIAESALSAAVPDLNPQELEYWQLDQRINVRGAQVDLETAEACIKLIESVGDKYTRELQDITGGAVSSGSELQKITGWLAGRGVHVNNLDEDSITELLKNPLPHDCERVIKIRQILASSSVKKVYAMKYMANSDGRIRELFTYCGADRTGRWAGNGPQPQNLPSKGPDTVQCDPISGCGRYYQADKEMCPHCGEPHAFSNSVNWDIRTIEAAIRDVRNLTPDEIENIWGDPLSLISGVLRGLFIAGPGKDLICSDYSAIEGVVAAALAGEQWRLDVFNSHGKIYETGASKITGIPLDEILEHKKRTGEHHPSRNKIGKVSELASGFGGWVNAWLQAGAGEYMDDMEIKKNILAWRAASPAIVEMWGGQNRKNPDRWEFTPEYYGLEGCAVLALLNPGYCYEYRGIKYEFDTSTGALCCTLLSGRIIYYHRAYLTSHTAKNGMPEYKINYYGRRGPAKKWGLCDTYGGKLFENVVQATARDILAHGMLNAEKHGYLIVLHVHDEPIAEVTEGTGSVKEFERLISTMPPWAERWPIRASGGWRGKRFHKA